jgi:hypothetical protein
MGGANVNLCSGSVSSLEDHSTQDRLLSVIGNTLSVVLKAYSDATLRATVSSFSKTMLLVSSSGKTTGSAFFPG